MCGCVSIKSSANCEPHLFCPFSSAEKFGVDSQLLHFLRFSPRKPGSNKLFCFMEQNFFATSQHQAAWLPLHACAYTPLFLPSRFSSPPPPPAALPPRHCVDAYLESEPKCLHPEKLQLKARKKVCMFCIKVQQLYIASRWKWGAGIVCQYSTGLMIEKF